LLHEFTRAQFLHLLTTEGGGGIDNEGYVPRKVEVTAYDGRKIEAYVLVCHPNSPRISKDYTEASSRYVNLLRVGAKNYNLHPKY